MRLTAFALILGTTTGAHAQSASPECLIIDGLDTVLTVQSRLSRNPDSILFISDIRVLRTEMSFLSERATLEAVESNSLSIKGYTFLRFLRNTQALLEMVSLDDPNSVKPHFSRGVRSNLSDIGQYLPDLRCSDSDIATAAQEAIQSARNATNSDDEDDAGEIIRAAADQLLNWTNLFGLIGLGISAVLTRRIALTLLVRHKRRAKRQPAIYAADYTLGNRTKTGVLIDINCFGTKLRHAETGPIGKGSTIDVQIGGDRIRGIVAWTNTHYAGVQFRTPISLTAVQKICETPMRPPQKQNGAPKDAAS